MHAAMPVADLGGGVCNPPPPPPPQKSSEPYIQNALLILCLACKCIDLHYSNEYGGSSDQF